MTGGVFRCTTGFCEIIPTSSIAGRSEEQIRSDATSAIQAAVAEDLKLPINAVQITKFTTAQVSRRQLLGFTDVFTKWRPSPTKTETAMSACVRTPLAK